MWDVLFVFISIVCFASGVLYVYACGWLWLKGERKNG